MDGQRKNHIRIIIGCVFLLMGIIAWQVFVASRFRITSISPNTGKLIPSSTESIVISFSKSLVSGRDYEEELSDDQAIVQSIEVENKQLTVHLKALDEEKQYAFSIKEVVAESGQIVQDIEISFITKYIPYNDLSKAQQERQLEQTDINAEEELLDTFLPYGDLGYYLAGLYVGEGQNYRYELRARITLSRADMSNRETAIELQKQNIREFIRSKQLDPDSYPIEYEIVEPPF